MSEIITLNIAELTQNIDQIETDTLLIIVDHHVLALYKKELKGLESLTGKRTIVWKARQGEDTKTLEELGKCLDFFLEKGVHRQSHVLAIGGGALSDFAGFVASTLLRGVPWSIIPTTLLSMVDACVGGKVAVNSTYGKNLIGHFYLPQNIFMSCEFLKTLPEKELLSGQGEICKYFFLSSEIYREFTPSGMKMEELIVSCSRYKEEVVKNDLKENGNRKFLNLGHTIGHGFEKMYGITHGESVFLGMLAIFILQERDDLKEKLLEIMSVLKLKIVLPWAGKKINLDELMGYISKDKKATSESELDLIFVRKMGEVYCESISFLKLRARIEEKLDELQNIVL